MDFTRIFDLFQYQAYKFPLKTSVSGKIGDQWKSYSTEECLNLINRLSAGILQLGVKSEDKVALIFSTNRPEWLFFDMALLQVGVVNIPIYPTVSDRELLYILLETKCTAVVISDAKLYLRLANLRTELVHIKHIISIEKVQGTTHWNDLLLSSTPADIMEVMDINKRIKPAQLATILYTSGTTGDPKGVMLSHYNIVSNVKSCLAFMPMNHGERVISVLPLSHIFERMVNYIYLSGGIEIHYGQSLENLKDDIREVKPHYFTAVPRLIEKLYEKFLAVGHRLPGWRKKYFFYVLELAKQYDPDRKNTIRKKIEYRIADHFVFRKWREALGGNIKGVIVGAAALSPVLNRVFSCAQINIREGYGLTETSPVIAFNRFEPGSSFIGSVGIPIPGIDIKIDEEGEIIVKGPNITSGYFLKPALTAEVIDQEGWFSTGDLGSFDGKHLFITGRKKELFKTSGGKYISPQPIEKRFSENEKVSQVIVLGSNKKFPIALIVPDFDELQLLLEAHNLNEPIVNKEEVLKHPLIVAHFDKLMEDVNAQLGQWEKIKKIKLLPDEWTIETGELTPTMKMRRHVLEKKYAALIEQMYQA